jgi:hypothetical protein
MLRGMTEKERESGASSGSDRPAGEDLEVNLVRRRLIATTAWVVPTVVLSLTLSERAAAASTPCVPRPGKPCP